MKLVPVCPPGITLCKHIYSTAWPCFPLHIIEGVLHLKLQLPHLPPPCHLRSPHSALKFKGREVCIMRMAPLKCSLRSCWHGGSCTEQRQRGYCDADVLGRASAERPFPWVFTVFLLLFIEHNVNEAINFTPHTRCRKKIMEIVNYKWITVIVIP